MEKRFPTIAVYSKATPSQTAKMSHAFAAAPFLQAIKCPLPSELIKANPDQPLSSPRPVISNISLGEGEGVKLRSAKLVQDWHHTEPPHFALALRRKVGLRTTITGSPRHTPIYVPTSSSVPHTQGGNTTEEQLNRIGRERGRGSPNLHEQDSLAFCKFLN